MADCTPEPVSEDALLLRFGNTLDLDTNARVHAAARALRAARLPGLTDIAPAFATLLLRFDPGLRTCTQWVEIIQAVLDDTQRTRPLPTANAPSAATIEIPVCYGGAYGVDLETVAAHAQLEPDAVIARHTQTTYTVAMLGFAPGFPYLLGLHESLQVPRRTTPRTRVPAGSVAIGGAQTGIYPRELPGGWNLIGRTPCVLFDPARDPPCLLAPGDRVRFRPLTPDAFARLAVPPA